MQAPLGLESLHGYLPPWLDGYRAHKPLSWMLKSLKTAIGSYLEASVLTAEIAASFPITNPFFGTLYSTAKSLSTQMPLTAAPSAGWLAALDVYCVKLGYG